MPRLAIPALLLCLGTSAALAQTDPSGINFVTVGAPGNAPWQGDGTPGDYSVGRGSVDYSFKIGQYEVTTAQWCEFFNAALDRPANDRIPDVFAPSQWGAVSTTPNNPGGQRFTVPAGNGMLPTGGVDWRTCAIFCNWLCGGKSSNRSAFLNGAYDVSTFGYHGTVFTDQLAHNPGAQYWIPTLDEWLKAAHYDPNRFGAGQGGWWTSSNRTNGLIPYGPPGVNVRLVPPPPYGPDPNGPLAQANAGWDDFSFPGYSPYTIPLGAYNSTSPWGLYDVAGGTSEWTQEVLYTNGVFPTDRLIAGSAWADGGDDSVHTFGGNYPSIGLAEYGFRVAEAVPSPGSLVVIGSSFLISMRRKPRGTKLITPGGINLPPQELLEPCH